MRSARFILAITSTAVAMSGSGCMTAYKKSVGANAEQVASKMYRVDFTDAWQATLDALKSVRLDVSNRDAGFIQTRWMDNTAHKNLTDGDGMIVPYMKSKYRFKVNVSRTTYSGRPVVKIAVQKNQLVQKDALEDFQHQESNLIEEKTLLYRIGRIMAVKARLARDEKTRIDQELKAFESGGIGEGAGPGVEPDPGTEFEPGVNSGAGMDSGAAMDPGPAPDPSFENFGPPPPLPEDSGEPGLESAPDSAL